MKSYEENILTFLSILLFRKRYLTGYWNHQVPLFHSKPDKSSRSQMFFKIGVRKHLCWSLFLTNLHVFRPKNNYFYRTTPVAASVHWFSDLYFYWSVSNFLSIDIYFGYICQNEIFIHQDWVRFGLKWAKLSQMRT